mmetsp:Transcript_78413/g.217772  ORF Transcript_78413/g.217772 Transcript_78413/m.217772 type:complete len:207 (-) Transcript_78413:214-834(-)
MRRLFARALLEGARHPRAEKINSVVQLQAVPRAVPDVHDAEALVAQVPVTHHGLAQRLVGPEVQRPPRRMVQQRDRLRALIRLRSGHQDVDDVTIDIRQLLALHPRRGDGLGDVSSLFFRRRGRQLLAAEHASGVAGVALEPNGVHVREFHSQVHQGGAQQRAARVALDFRGVQRGQECLEEVRVVVPCEGPPRRTYRQNTQTALH